MASTQERRPIPGVGLVKGLAVTMKHLLHRSVTQQYPHEKPDLPARTRGVIALKEANCTVCYKCSRACPDWCIYIDAHKETHEPASGGKARSAKILDRFAIDYSLCMYCGICVEVCPFDALFWSPEYEYAEFDVHELVHEKERLEAWTLTVLPPPEIETDAEVVAEAVDGAGAPAPEARSLEPSSANAPAPSPTVAPQVAAAAPAAKVEIAPDQAVYDETLAAELAKGTAERVAIGKAKRAAMMAAKKAAGAGEGAETPAAKGLEPASASTPAPDPASSAQGGGGAPEEGSRLSPDVGAPPPPPTQARVEVEPDQGVYDETLAAELAKGTPERVAIGKAKRAAMLAAKKKAQG